MLSKPNGRQPWAYKDTTGDTLYCSLWKSSTKVPGFSNMKFLLGQFDPTTKNLIKRHNRHLVFDVEFPRDVVLGVSLDRKVVKAAHIVPKSLDEAELAHLFGADADV